MKTADPCSRVQIGLPSITNGAIATAEANFLAVYGYDVRAEVFGSDGMVSAGDTALTGKTHHTATGRVKRTVRSDVELFRDAYAAEFASFVEAVRMGQVPLRHQNRCAPVNFRILCGSVSHLAACSSGENETSGIYRPRFEVD